jgi:hypothetical protein
LAFGFSLKNNRKSSKKQRNQGQMPVPDKFSDLRRYKNIAGKITNKLRVDALQKLPGIRFMSRETPCHSYSILSIHINKNSLINFQTKFQISNTSTEWRTYLWTRIYTKRKDSLVKCNLHASPARMLRVAFQITQEKTKAIFCPISRCHVVVFHKIGLFALIKLKAHDERGRIRELQTLQSETSELNLDDLQLEEN